MSRTVYLVLALLLLCASVAVVQGAATEELSYDHAQVRHYSSTATITTTAADYTTLQSLLSITPTNGHALRDVRVTIDLDYATTGFADLHTSETIQFCAGRKVDGTNWRIDAEQATTAISGTNADALGGRSVTLIVGDVTAAEDARIYLVMSAEGNSNFTLPYRVSYRGPSRATIE